MILSKTDFEALLQARHGAPHAVLGMHPCTHRRSRGLVVRALLRDAVACKVALDGEDASGALPMKLLAAEGLFELFIPGRPEVVGYELIATSADGRVRRLRAPEPPAPDEAEAIHAVIELTINGISGGLKNTG